MIKFPHYLELFVVCVSGDLWTLTAVVDDLLCSSLLMRVDLVPSGVIAVTEVLAVRLTLPADGERRIDPVPTVVLPGIFYNRARL